MARQMPDEIIVTEEHLDRAIKLFERSGDVCTNCVMTVAVREQTGRKYVTAAGNVYTANGREPVFTMPGSSKVMDLFDDLRWHELRLMLPARFKLVPGGSES